GLVLPLAWGFGRAAMMLPPWGGTDGVDSQAACGLAERHRCALHSLIGMIRNEGKPPSPLRVEGGGSGLFAAVAAKAEDVDAVGEDEEPPGGGVGGGETFEARGLEVGDSPAAGAGEVVGRLEGCARRGGLGAAV